MTKKQFNIQFLIGFSLVILGLVVSIPLITYGERIESNILQYIGYIILLIDEVAGTGWLLGFMFNNWEGPDKEKKESEEERKQKEFERDIRFYSSIPPQNSIGEFVTRTQMERKYGDKWKEAMKREDWRVI